MLRLRSFLLTCSTLAPCIAFSLAASPGCAADAAPNTATRSVATLDWSSFRGPTGMGVTASKQLPTEWSESQNILWKAPLAGAGASSPIVWRDRIYLTSYTGYFVPGEEDGQLDNLKRHLLAFDRQTGKPIWDQAVPAVLPEEEKIRDHGFAANTPAADDDRIYVFFGKSGVFAFDHDGKQQWHANVGSNTSGWGTSGSPVLYNDLVFINASVESESLVALDRATGKEKWRAEGIREAWNTPVVVKAPDGREELIIASQGNLLSFNPNTGEPYWSCKTDITWYMVPSVVAKDGIIYCLGGRSGTAALAVRAGGQGDVTDSHRLWTSVKGSNVTSPVVFGDHLYWMNDSRGVAYCAQLTDGKVLYEQRLDRADQIYASPVLANGRIYYLARDGRTFVVAATPEFKQLAINDLRDGSIFNGSPAVDGNRLLIRSDKFLYCIGEK